MAWPGPCGKSWLVTGPGSLPPKCRCVTACHLREAHFCSKELGYSRGSWRVARLVKLKSLQHVSGAGPAAKVGTWYLAVFCVRGGSLA